MEQVKDAMASVPGGLQLVLSAVGALYLITKLLSSVDFFLNMCLLSGHNVSLADFTLQTFQLC